MDLPLTLDSYAYVFDQLIHGRGNNYTAITPLDIHTQLYLPFANMVVDLVNFVKRNPASNASQDDLDTIDRYRQTFRTVCQWWTGGQDSTVRGNDGEIYERSLWHRFDRMAKWAPAIGRLQQSEGFDGEHQHWVKQYTPQPPTYPIDVNYLLNLYGSGWRPPYGPPSPFLPFPPHLGSHPINTAVIGSLGGQTQGGQTQGGQTRGGSTRGGPNQGGRGRGGPNQGGRGRGGPNQGGRGRGRGGGR